MILKMNLFKKQSIILTKKTLNNENNDFAHEHLVNSINSAAEAVIPKLVKEKLHKPWHDDEKLRDLYTQKDTLIANNVDSKVLMKLRKKIRLRARYLKNEFMKSEAEKINQLALNRKLQELFQRAKEQETTLKPIPASCPYQNLLNHFKSHFNPPDPSITSTPDEFKNESLPRFIGELQRISQSIAINDNPPDINEIQQHLQQLKTNKAFNDVDATLLKQLDHPVMLQVIQRMTSNLWENLDVPHAWGNSRIQALWKGKGSKKDPGKYRGLSIGSTICKLVINLILTRLRPWYELQLCDEQNGFRKNRGTTEGIYTIKRIQQITNRKKQPLFLLFVDLTAAFDQIPRKWLFESIRLRFATGQSPRLFNILEKLYINTSLTFEEINETFNTSSGVRQGGPESPFLFNLFIDFVMRVFMKNSHDINFFQHKYRFNVKSFTRTERYEMRNNGVPLNGCSKLPWGGYADDLVLFCLDLESLKSGTELLNEIFTRFGLKINKLKTETMIINYPNEEYPKSIISLNETPLKNVRNFKYLGSYIDIEEPNTGNTEVNHRIQIASVKFTEMSNLLQNFRINLRTRIKFLNSYVRSRLTYACQNWNLTSSQRDRLNATYRSFLRRMVRNGQKHVNESENDYRMMINNRQLHVICGTQDLDVFIKSQQCNYMAHVVRMKLSRNIKQLAFNNDHYTKRGRPIKSLLDQVTENMNMNVDGFCSYAIGNDDVNLVES